MALGALQFAAFLSYSRHDGRLARWLVRELEGFAPPRQTADDLAARKSAFAAARPIFRDEHDMPVGGAVPDRLAEVIDASASMIVLCTPSSAGSEWVDKEIRLFAERHPDRKIIAVVGEGDPDSSECYPPALLALGKPLAADLRAPRDRRQAVVKIAAAVLGVDVDQLVGRVRKREAERRRWIAIGASTAAAGFVGLGIVAFTMSQQAERANDLARANVERLLTDTRKEMDEIGLMKAKAAVHNAAKAYFDGKAGRRLNSKDLFLKAEWLRQEGIDAYKRGEKELALAQRQEAYAATAELLERDPDNPDFLFSHTQSAYWVGDYYLREGPTEETRKPWEAYRDTAEHLVAIAPAYPGAGLEFHYANVNLGILALEQERDPREAAKSFEAALKALDATPTELDAKLNLSRSHLQYVEALAQFALAADVVAAVQAWEPLLEDLEKSRGASDDVEFHLANAWNKVSKVRYYGGAPSGDTAGTGRTPAPRADPDNLTSVSFTVELDLATEVAPACNTLSAPSQKNLTDRPQLSLAARCLPRMAPREQGAFCQAFGEVLGEESDTVGLQLEVEDMWAAVLTGCSRIAARSGRDGLSRVMDDVAKDTFFARNFEEMRLWTQLDLAGFVSSASNAWITDLNTSLDSRGWRKKGGK